MVCWWGLESLKIIQHS